MGGKTTIFNALTNSEESVGTGSREMHISNVKVPDKRIDKLKEIYNPKKTTYAEINFVDFPSGFDSKTEPQLINKIREQDSIALVVGAFLSDDVKKIQGDFLSILDEIILLDMIICERRINRLERENKKDTEYKTLVKCRDTLDSERFIYKLDLTPEEEKTISNFNFLTQIPIIVIFNCSEEEYRNVRYREIEDICIEKGFDLLYLSGKLEMEIAGLPEEEQEVFLSDLGLEESARERFIRKAYKKMDLISFFTTGEDEVKAWTIEKGAIAQRAAGKIHSDIERGFIRAEVMAYEDFIANDCDENRVKSEGKLRLEGKNYEVSDGDIISFRFNV